MRIAYADPPYIGMARKHYGPDAKEVNHRLLIAYLQEFDGWALSCSSPSLRIILPLCPSKTRIAAWVKPFASFKPGVNPAYAWEPVLFVPARANDRGKATVRDWVAANITLQRGLAGAKPEAFGMWLFDLLGMDAGDEFVDVFPGTNAVSRAWDAWKWRRVTLFSEETAQCTSGPTTPITARGCGHDTSHQPT